MTAFSQHISNYVLGFSDQPDELKVPGQTRDLKNTFPDPTFGLLKRPGFKYIKNLTSGYTTEDAEKVRDGKWFNYYRQNNFEGSSGSFQITGNTEEYVGNITQEGYLRMWNSTDGTEIEVEYSDVAQYDFSKPSLTARSTADLRANQNVPYFVHKERQDIQITTINDFTFIVNRTVFPEMGDVTNGTFDKYHCYIDMTVVAYGRKYQLDFTQGATTGSATYDTPTSGSTVLNAATILDDLVTDINAIGTLSATKIGNGIYVESDDEFTVETPTKELFDILAPFNDVSDDGVTIVKYTAINNITELPTQCKHELITRVSNSDNQEDDVYLKFHGAGDQDGPGVWEETVKPGLYNSFDKETMPYQAVRRPILDASGNITGVKFVVSPILWEERQVGDEETNPRPSFAPIVGEEFGRPINKMLFFQNRLVFLSDENVIMSRSGDIKNFWVKTALTVSPVDPIDLRASNTYASVLQDGVVLTNGLVLFSPFQQFLVSTENDVLAPDAVKIRSLSNYAFSAATSPVNMGASIGFISEAGLNSRFYEMPQVFRDVDPEVVNLAQPIQRRFPAEVEFIASSKEEGFITFLKYKSNEIFAYRYFNNGEKRILSSWFRMTIEGEGLFHFMIEDKYYTVESIDGMNLLQSINLRDRINATDSTGSDYFYRVNLDYRQQSAAATYDKTTRRSTITYTGPNINNYGKLYAVQGSNIAPVAEDNGDFTVPGDWSSSDPIVVGYTFEYLVEFPTFYRQEQSGDRVKAYTQSSLTIHRVKLNFGPTGYFHTTVQRTGMDDYTVEYESTPMDAYQADSLPYVVEKTESISMYSKNKNARLYLTSEHPAPCTLYSATWEGDYNELYYKRV